MTIVKLAIPIQLLDEARALAKRDSLSLTRFISAALSEKLLRASERRVRADGIGQDLPAKARNPKRGKCVQKS